MAGFFYNLHDSLEIQPVLLNYKRFRSSQLKDSYTDGWFFFFSLLSISWSWQIFFLFKMQSCQKTVVNVQEAFQLQALQHFPILPPHHISSFQTPFTCFCSLYILKCLSDKFDRNSCVKIQVPLVHKNIQILQMENLIIQHTFKHSLHYDVQVFYEVKESAYNILMSQSVLPLQK